MSVPTQQRQDSIYQSLYQCAMMMGKHLKKRQQQQSGSGRAVLVTFYVVRPRRNRDGGGASAASSRQVYHHHYHHHHHHHHHLHQHLPGRSHETRRGSDRRADLLEYSRQLRATSATATTATPPRNPKPPLPPRRDIKVIKPVSAVRHDDHPVAGDDRRLVPQRRLERAASLQEIRYRCLGYGGDWNWKKVLKLVLPCQSNSTDHQSSTKSNKRRDSVDNDRKNNSKQAKAWPAAAQLVSKLKVNRMSRRRTSRKDDEGLVKKLFSMFRQQSRPSR